MIRLHIYRICHGIEGGQIEQVHRNPTRFLLTACRIMVNVWQHPAITDNIYPYTPYIYISTHIHTFCETSNQTLLGFSGEDRDSLCSVEVRASLHKWPVTTATGLEHLFLLGLRSEWWSRFVVTQGPPEREVSMGEHVDEVTWNPTCPWMDNAWWSPQDLQRVENKWVVWTAEDKGDRVREISCFYHIFALVFFNFLFSLKHYIVFGLHCESVMHDQGFLDVLWISFVMVFGSPAMTTINHKSFFFLLIVIVGHVCKTTLSPHARKAL